MTTNSSDILNLTIGRVTNEQLEATTAVHFKTEMEDERTGADSGPIYLAVSFSTPLVAFNTGEAEWFPYEVAVDLAEALGVPLETS